MFLSRIAIKNFRCLKDAELELTPLTVIYGENGSGKSSILEAVQFLKQLIDREVTFETAGAQKDKIDFGSFSDLVSNNNEEEWISIRIGIKISMGELENNLIFSNLEEVSQHLKLSRPIREIGYQLSFRKAQKRRRVETEQSLWLDDKMVIKVQQIFIKGRYQNLVVVPDFEAPGELQVAGNFSHVLLENSFHFSTTKSRTAEHQQLINLYGNFTRDLVRIIKQVVTKYYLLRPTRATPRLLVNTEGTAEWVGLEGEELIRVLSLIFGNVELEETRKHLIRWGKTFGLEKLHAGYIGNNRLRATFKDPIMDANNDIVFAGHGSKQMLVVLTQLFHSESGSIIALEEPEISLHLALQLELPKLFAQAKQQQKQIIATSHSGDFLTAFKPLFLKSSKYLLTKEDFAVYHLRKTPKGSSIERQTVLSDGRVKDFIPSIVKAEKRLVSDAM